MFCGDPRNISYSGSPTREPARRSTILKGDRRVHESIGRVPPGRLLAPAVLHRPSSLSVPKVGSVDSKARIWRTDPATLRNVLLDPGAVEDRLQECPPLERVWILTLLGRDEEALAAGRRLLAESPDRFRPLLVLAQAHQRQYQWHEAAHLHEEALRLARTRAREALVRHQIGRRLFDEARYRDAAAEFQWAADLYRTSGRDRLAEVSRAAMKRARELDAKR